jgi:hypothetical protein
MPTLTVTGEERAVALGSTMESCWRLVADFLARPLPEHLVLEVRRRPGISEVRGHTMYLPDDASGYVDLTYVPHEMVHVVAGPSPNRFLAEGIAVYADASLRLGKPCWPCYRLSPDAWAADVRCRCPATSVEEAIAQTNALGLDWWASGPVEVARAWCLYVTAGSFTGFLFRLRPESFWEGYARGSCWESSAELAALEQRWREQLPDRLTDRERRLMAASARDARRDLDRSLKRPRRSFPASADA